MKKYKELWKNALQDFHLGDLLEAFFGASVFTGIIIAPFIIMAIETLVVYFYLLYTFTVLFYVLAVVYFYLVYRLYLKALKLMKSEIPHFDSIKKLAFIHWFILTVLGFLVTILFIVWWIPLLLV